jgi:hypothetical protein
MELVGGGGGSGGSSSISSSSSSSGGGGKAKRVSTLAMQVLRQELLLILHFGSG